MQRGLSVAKARSLRRAELLVLDLQKDILEYHIRGLEKLPSSTERGLKRDLPSDRNKASKKPKHELTPMTVDEMFAQCGKLLAQLRKNNNSGPFLDPVDPIALNCPDYFKIVKKPMDFKTVAARLKPTKRSYKSPLEFRDDVRQVFKNCSLYNPVGNQIRIMGDRLSEYFESLWTKANIEKAYMKIQPGLKRERTGDVADEADKAGEEGKSKKIRTHDTAYHLKKLSGLRHRMEELMKKAQDKTTVPIDVDRPLSFWQRRKLNASLETADAEVIKEVAKIFPEKVTFVEVMMEDVEDVVLKHLWKCAMPLSKDATVADPQPMEEELLKGEEGSELMMADAPGDAPGDRPTEEAEVKPALTDGGTVEAGGKPSTVPRDETTFLHPTSTVDTSAFGSVIPVDSGRIGETTTEKPDAAATEMEVVQEIEGDEGDLLVKDVIPSDSSKDGEEDPLEATDQEDVEEDVKEKDTSEDETKD